MRSIRAAGHMARETKHWQILVQFADPSGVRCSRFLGSQTGGTEGIIAMHVLIARVVRLVAPLREIPQHVLDESP